MEKPHLYKKLLGMVVCNCGPSYWGGWEDCLSPGGEGCWSHDHTTVLQLEQQSKTLFWKKERKREREREKGIKEGRKEGKKEGRKEGRRERGKDGPYVTYREKI